MKSKLSLILILSLCMVIVASCSEQPKGTNEKTPVPTETSLPADEKPAQSVKEEAKIEKKQEAPQPEVKFKPVPPKRYLLVNGIQVEPKSTVKELPNMNLRIECPEIKGLLNKRVQDQLNKEFLEESQKFLKKPVPSKIDVNKKPAGQDYRFEKWYSFGVNANYNNVLSLNVYYSEAYGPDFNESKVIPVLYELKTGKKLGIQDLFVEGVDGIKMVNEQITCQILQENQEEMALCKPFEGIFPDQRFFLTDTMLFILFDERSTEFVYPNFQIGIPLEKFNGAINIFDKYANTREKIYAREKLDKKMLPSSIKARMGVVNEHKPQYNIWVYSAQFQNVPSKELEKKLNSIFNAAVDLNRFRKDAVKAYQTSKEKQPSQRVRNIEVRANFGDILSITMFDSENLDGKIIFEDRKYFCFNTKTGKQMELKDLFNKDADYIKIIKEIMLKQSGERNIPHQDIEKLDSTLDKARFLLDEGGLMISFKPGDLSPEIRDEMQFYFSIEELKQENLSIFN
ncbi:MAG: DUF3298 domain-containing protein [Clostridia bacterium]|nr:DUF3298 domain-containing protein [Clostridia bacterium]